MTEPSAATKPDTEKAWPALTFAEATARLTAPGSPFAVSEIPIRGVPTSWPDARVPGRQDTAWPVVHSAAAGTSPLRRSHHVPMAEGSPS